MRRVTLLALAALLVLSGSGSAQDREPGKPASNAKNSKKASAKATRTRTRTVGRSKPAPRPAVPLDDAVVNDAALATAVGPGSKGGAVLRAQVLLARAHFSTGEIDAAYGSNMHKAVAAFQRSRGLSETGVVDAATWQALDADTAPVVGPETLAP